MAQQTKNAPNGASIQKSNIILGIVSPIFFIFFAWFIGWGHEIFLGTAGNKNNTDIMRAAIIVAFVGFSLAFYIAFYLRNN